MTFDLRNEFGADDWELVSNWSSAARGAGAGPQTAGVPIASTQIFKRPVETAPTDAAWPTVPEPSPPKPARRPRSA